MSNGNYPQLKVGVSNGNYPRLKVGVGAALTVSGEHGLSARQVGSAVWPSTVSAGFAFCLEVALPAHTTWTALLTNLTHLGSLT